MQDPDLKKEEVVRRRIYRLERQKNETPAETRARLDKAAEHNRASRLKKKMNKIKNAIIEDDHERAPRPIEAEENPVPSW